MDDFGFPVFGEPGHGEVDRRAARFYMEVEPQNELPRFARPPQDDSPPGSPIEDAVRPAGPSEREGAASARVDPSDSARYASRGPVVELLRFRERVEYSFGLCLDEHRELQVRTGHGGMIGSDAVGATFRDGLQAPQAHPPSVLHGPACRVRERDVAMVSLQDRRISRRVLEFVGDAGFRGLNRPREGEPSQDGAFLDRGLPGTPLRRNDAGLPAELERPSDLRFDPTPSAKPTGEVLNPEEPLAHGPILAVDEVP